jgi:hypothetical protein
MPDREKEKIKRRIQTGIRAAEREKEVARGERERVIVNGNQDPLQVDGIELAKYLRRWADRYDADHPPGNKHGAGFKIGKGDGYHGMGSVAYLAEKTGLDRKSIDRSLNGYYRWTSLYIADTLLSATGMTYLLQNELTPVPNPQWSREAWEAFKRASGGCETD